MGWAGHKLTDSGTGKRGVRWESLDDGTCLVSLLACDSKSVELEEAGSKLEDLGHAGGYTGGLGHIKTPGELEEAGGKLEVLEHIGGYTGDLGHIKTLEDLEKGVP